MSTSFTFEPEKEPFPGSFYILFSFFSPYQGSHTCFSGEEAAEPRGFRASGAPRKRQGLSHVQNKKEEYP